VKKYAVLASLVIIGCAPVKGVRDFGRHVVRAVRAPECDILSPREGETTILDANGRATITLDCNGNAEVSIRWICMGQELPYEVARVGNGLSEIKSPEFMVVGSLNPLDAVVEMTIKGKDVPTRVSFRVKNKGKKS